MGKSVLLVREVVTSVEMVPERENYLKLVHKRPGMFRSDSVYEELVPIQRFRHHRHEEISVAIPDEVVEKLDAVVGSLLVSSMNSQSDGLFYPAVVKEAQSITRVLRAEAEGNHSTIRALKQTLALALAMIIILSAALIAA